MQQAHFPILPKLDAHFARDRSTQRRRLLVWSGAMLVGAMLWLPPALHTFENGVPAQPTTLLDDDPFAGEDPFAGDDPFADESPAADPTSAQPPSAHHGLESGK